LCSRISFTEFFIFFFNTPYFHKFCQCPQSHTFSIATNLLQILTSYCYVPRRLAQIFPRHIFLFTYWQSLPAVGNQRYAYYNGLCKWQSSLLQPPVSAHPVRVRVTLRLTVSQSVLVSSHCLTVIILSLEGRPLWREDGSAVCESQSAVLNQLSVCTIIYILHVSYGTKMYT
jgi:hypothetical protein